MKFDIIINDKVFITKNNEIEGIKWLYEALCLLEKGSLKFDKIALKNVEKDVLLMSAK